MKIPYTLNPLDKDLNSRFKEMLDKTIAMVECSSYEKLKLHFEHIEFGYKVDQVYEGYSLIIGELAGWPVNVSFGWIIIGGKVLGLYECTSTVVHHDMIAEWIKINMPQVVKTTDAMNVHNAIKAIGAEIDIDYVKSTAIPEVVKRAVEKIHYVTRHGNNEFSCFKIALKSTILSISKRYENFTEQVSPKNWRTTGHNITDLKGIAEDIDRLVEITPKEKEIAKKYL